MGRGNRNSRKRNSLTVRQKCVKLLKYFSTLGTYIYTYLTLVSKYILKVLKTLLLAVIILPLALVTAIFRLLILPGIRKIRKYYRSKTK